GNNGHYVIHTGAGDDTVELEGTTVTPGDLAGGAGVDALKLIGAILAVANFDAASTGFERLSASYNYCSGDDTANNLDFSGFALLNRNGISVAGSGGDDVITGTANGDSLGGGEGDDLLVGGRGDDYMRGDSGN